MENFRRAPSSRSRAGLAFLLYAALTVFYTWPMGRDPSRLALPYPDLLGHVWGISWVVRQGLLDPWHLYNANMYWPESLSLAYTESLIPQSLAAAPVILAGGGPLLAHNLVLLLTYPLAATFMYALAWSLTRSRAQSALAGLAYGFSAYRWLHVVHIGVLSYQWLPLVLLVLRRAVLRPRWPTLALLAILGSVQALSSGYHAVTLGLMILVVSPFYVRRAWRRRSLLPVAASLAIAAVVVLGAAWPYRLLQERLGISRGRAASLHWSARPESYLNPGEYVGLPHLEALNAAVADRWPLFPGSAILLLAPFGVRRGARARLAIVIAVTGIALSFGPEIHFGPWSVAGPFELLRRVPPINMMRDPTRFVALSHLGLGLLAALGLRRLGRRRWGPQLAVLALCLQAAEAYPYGMANRVREVTPPPPFTAWLARAPRGPVLELPWDSGHPFASGEYLYWSTAHWQPMVNGHGTFEPPGKLALGSLVARFPTGYTSRILRGQGVRYVVLHTEALAAERRDNVVAHEAELPEGVRLAASFGGDRVYEIDANGPSEPRPAERVPRGQVE